MLPLAVLSSSPPPRAFTAWPFAHAPFPSCPSAPLSLGFVVTAVSCCNNTTAVSCRIAKTGVIAHPCTGAAVALPRHLPRSHCTGDRAQSQLVWGGHPALQQQLQDRVGRNGLHSATARAGGRCIQHGLNGCRGQHLCFQGLGVLHDLGAAGVQLEARCSILWLGGEVTRLHGQGTGCCALVVCA